MDSNFGSRTASIGVLATMITLLSHQVSGLPSSINNHQEQVLAATTTIPALAWLMVLVSLLLISTVLITCARCKKTKGTITTEDREKLDRAFQSSQRNRALTMTQPRDAENKNWRPESFDSRNPLLGDYDDNVLLNPTTHESPSPVINPVSALTPFLQHAWGVGGHSVEDAFPSNEYLTVETDDEEEEAVSASAADDTESSRRDGRGESFSGFNHLSEQRAGGDRLESFSGFSRVEEEEETKTDGGAGAADGDGNATDDDGTDSDTFAGFGQEESDAMHQRVLDKRRANRRTEEDNNMERKLSKKALKAVEGRFEDDEDASEAPPPYKPKSDLEFDETEASWKRNITRADAINLLKKIGTEGAFVVRPTTESTSGNNLSVFQKGKVRHFMIQMDEDDSGIETYYLEEYEDELTCPTLDELISELAEEIYEPLTVKLDLQAVAENDHREAGTTLDSPEINDDFMEDLDGLPEWKRTVIVRKRALIVQKEREMEEREAELRRREQEAADQMAKLQEEKEAAEAEIEAKRQRAIQMAKESARLAAEREAELEALEAERIAREERLAEQEQLQREKEAEEREKKVQTLQNLIYDDVEKPEEDFGFSDEPSSGEDEDENSPSKRKIKRGLGRRRTGSVKLLANAMAPDLRLIKGSEEPDDAAGSPNKPPPPPPAPAATDLTPQSSPPDKASFLAKIGANTDAPNPFSSPNFAAALQGGKASLAKASETTPSPSSSPGGGVDAQAGLLGELTQKLSSRKLSGTPTLQDLEKRNASSSERTSTPTDPFQAELFSRLASRRNTAESKFAEEKKEPPKVLPKPKPVAACTTEESDTVGDLPDDPPPRSLRDRKNSRPEDGTVSNLIQRAKAKPEQEEEEKPRERRPSSSVRPGTVAKNLGKFGGSVHTKNSDSTPDTTEEGKLSSAEDSSKEEEEEAVPDKEKVTDTQVLSSPIYENTTTEQITAKQKQLDTKEAEITERELAVQQREEELKKETLKKPETTTTNPTPSPSPSPDPQEEPLPPLPPKATQRQSLPPGQVMPFGTFSDDPYVNPVSPVKESIYDDAGLIKPTVPAWKRAVQAKRASMRRSPHVM